MPRRKPEGSPRRGAGAKCRSAARASHRFRADSSGASACARGRRTACSPSCAIPASIQDAAEPTARTGDNSGSEAITCGTDGSTPACRANAANPGTFLPHHRPQARAPRAARSVGRARSLPSRAANAAEARAGEIRSGSLGAETSTIDLDVVSAARQVRGARGAGKARLSSPRPGRGARGSAPPASCRESAATRAPTSRRRLARNPVTASALRRVLPPRANAGKSPASRFRRGLAERSIASGPLSRREASRSW